ncbi:MAG: DNA polymerase III subunit chi [Paracoccaceae bacterium]
MSAPRAVFYHLTRLGLDETLATILTRAHRTGWKVAVRGTARDALEALDARLWALCEGEAFLPHGLEGGPQDAAQPILLGTGALPEGARGLVLLDGAMTDPDEARGLERVWVLFDGNDPAQLDGARGLWRGLTTGGMAAQYWSDETGAWVMKVERPAGASPGDES